MPNTIEVASWRGLWRRLGQGLGQVGAGVAAVWLQSAAVKGQGLGVLSRPSKKGLGWIDKKVGRLNSDSKLTVPPLEHTRHDRHSLTMSAPETKQLEVR